MNECLELTFMSEIGHYFYMHIISVHDKRTRWTIPFHCLYQQNRSPRNFYDIKTWQDLSFENFTWVREISLHKINNTVQTWFWRKTRQIWGIWKLRPTYSPETPNLDQNRWCFVPCDLEIWWMTLENNRASLHCCFKLCATFHSHRWIQTGVTVRKRPIWVKFQDF